MTPQTQTALSELNMSEEELAERTAKMDALSSNYIADTVRAATAPAKAKKNRSDAGKPRVKAPAAAPAGVAEVRRLITERESARVLLDTAKTNLDYARHSWGEACERLDEALNALEKS